MHRFVGALIAGLTFGANHASADGFYAYGGVAAQFFSEQEENDVEFSLDEGFSLDGGIGYDSGPLSFELLAEFGATEFEEIDGSDAEGDFTWFALVPSIYYNWRNYDGFAIRAGLGIGYIDIETDDVEDEFFFYADDSEDYVLFQVSGGVLFPLTPRLDLAPTYRFRMIDDIEFDEGVHILEAGLLYRF